MIKDEGVPITLSLAAKFSFKPLIKNNLSESFSINSQTSPMTPIIVNVGAVEAMFASIFTRTR